MCDQIKVIERNYDFSQQMDIRKSCKALIQAEVYMKEGMTDKSLKVLIDFMVNNQRDLNDDFNPLIIGFLLTNIVPCELNITDIIMSPLLNLIYLESAKTLEEIKKIANLVNEVFESIVEYTLKCIFNICIRNKSSEELKLYRDKDLYSDDDNNYFVSDNSYLALIQCLQPSLPPEILFSGGINTLLRMISILFHLNRYMGTMTNKFNNIIPTIKFEIFKDETLIHGRFLNGLFAYCPFLFNQSFRIYKIKSMAFRKISRDKYNERRDIKLFEVSRNNTLENILDILSKEDPHPFWDFYFADEPARGIGPNKEFYIKFSQDIQRYDLNLWIGEPQLSSNGIEYVYSKGGLFPSSCLELNENSRKILRTLGILMAKSLIDGVAMDLNFSTAFWNYFLTKKEILLLTDEISSIIPNHYEFVHALKQLDFDAKEIKKNTSLTTDEQLEALSELKYNGTKLEDLYINFTLPGYPDIELIDEGENKYLNIENVGQYIESLMEWYRTNIPSGKINCIKNGFESIMGRYYRWFLKEDMIMMFSSIEPMQWTVAQLKQNCVFGSYLAKKRKLVKRLLNVLCSLSVDEQKQFLSFVTTSPRLPVGGLSSLEPRLEFDLLETNGNPNELLPMTFTCGNLLLIPNYSCAHILRKKLLMAIGEGGDNFSFE